MKVKLGLFGGLILLMIILSLVKKTNQSDINSDHIYDEVVVVETTRNVFTIIGHKVALIIEKGFTLIFSLINKVLEFAFGV